MRVEKGTRSCLEKHLKVEKECWWVIFRIHISYLLDTNVIMLSLEFIDDDEDTSHSKAESEEI